MTYEKKKTLVLFGFLLFLKKRKPVLDNKECCVGNTDYIKKIQKWSAKVDLIDHLEGFDRCQFRP